ncbi:MAG: 50S ribosomal protein L22 [Candidatus Staskawiczbacteria bacterium]
MEIKVKLSNLRTSPRKVRQVIDLVRGKNVVQAQSVLLFTVNKSARSVSKLLSSAVASAKNDFHIADELNLYISKITVDEGPKMKRWHPMSRGRAYPIIKRSAHIELTIAEIKPTNAVNKEIKKEVKVKKTVEKVAKKTAEPKVNSEVKAKRKTKTTKK